MTTITGDQTAIAGKDAQSEPQRLGSGHRLPVYQPDQQHAKTRVSLHVEKTRQNVADRGQQETCRTTNADAVRQCACSEGGAVCLGGPTYPRQPWGSVTRRSDVPSRKQSQVGRCSVPRWADVHSPFVGQCGSEARRTLTKVRLKRRRGSVPRWADVPSPIVTTKLRHIGSRGTLVHDLLGGCHSTSYSKGFVANLHRQKSARGSFVQWS